MINQLIKTLISADKISVRRDKMLDKSFNTINIYKKALDASWLRNKAISNNIANVNTPNYKRQVVNFDEILRSHMEQGGSTMMAKTNAAHIDAPELSLNPTISQVTNTAFREDGNNVNIDVEMTERTKNEIRYTAMTDKVTGTFSNLRTAIRGGR